MKKKGQSNSNLLSRVKLGLRPKLIAIFLVENILPIIILVAILWTQITILGAGLRDIAVGDSTEALNSMATENIERLTTDTAKDVADFLYARDADLRFLSKLDPSDALFKAFIEGKTGRVLQTSQWEIDEETDVWVSTTLEEPPIDESDRSTNPQNDNNDGFHYRAPDGFVYEDVPLYNEITYFDTTGRELYKAVSNERKIYYPLSEEKRQLGEKNSWGRYKNSYVQAESYYDSVFSLRAGEIYVSDVIGAYVGTNLVGMYTPKRVAAAAESRGYAIDYNDKAQAYSGIENPNGKRFEGIVRWVMPVTDDKLNNGNIIGYISLALNHDHIMELVDHITPMNERYTELPSAFEGNYAFIWDYNCKSIAHPRHHSITGFDPLTGNPQVPWLEQSIFDGWKEAACTDESDPQWFLNGKYTQSWDEYISATGIKSFDEQKREKTPAAELTHYSMVGLDGRYLNNAPQCTGWMDLTKDGGSGSFYIYWTGLWKLTTAAAIPYYTGQYAPSATNSNSYRGFGFVAIGAGLDDFEMPAELTKIRLTEAISNNLMGTAITLVFVLVGMLALVVVIVIFVASSITGNITGLVNGISRFRRGERHFRFDTDAQDEFGTLADAFDEMATSIESSVKNPLSITDRDYKIIYMNEGGRKITGKTLEELVGASYQTNSVYPSGGIYDPIFALENGREAEVYHLPSGRYVKGNANHLYDKHGNKVGYIIESMDMTDIINQQLETERQRTLLDTIFSTSPDLIWYIDTDMRYVTVNPRYAAISGLPAREIAGKTGKEIYSPTAFESCTAGDYEVIRDKKPVLKEEKITFADGHEETLESLRLPIFDSAGEHVGALGYARDLTARVRIENKLRETQQELENAVREANAANNHKGDFLARMSHEIRTPMNAIIGLTNILLRELTEDMKVNPDPDSKLPDVHDKLRQIESSSQHLLGLLNDILDISKIEAGKIELAEEKMNMPELVDTIATIIKPRCKDKEIEYIADIDDFSGVTYLSDPLRLRQVLINLLGNAVKFTPEGGKIFLSVKKLQSEEGKDLVRFSARDTGIGIKHEFMDSIFKPFEQENKNVASRYGGTGLGLSISKNIVELFGGKMTVFSEVDKGSEFRFEIWLNQTEAVVKESFNMGEIAGKFAGKHILVVDDVAINRMIIHSLLEGTGVEIEDADDGSTAIEVFRNSPVGHFDAVLMDVKMTKVDGYEATRQIRRLVRSDAQTTPIVAVTANAFKDDIDHASEAGMNSHLAKPIVPEALLRVLHKYLIGKKSN